MSRDYLGCMTPLCTDPAAYRAIKADYLECIMTRRHSWPPRAQQHPQHVRLYVDSQTAPLELTEYYGTCVLCGTTRTLFRDRYSRDWMWAEYVYPDSYLAPVGFRWDPELIREEYDRYNPISKKIKTVHR